MGDRRLPLNALDWSRGPLSDVTSQFLSDCFDSYTLILNKNGNVRGLKSDFLVDWPFGEVADWECESVSDSEDDIDIPWTALPKDLRVLIYRHEFGFAPLCSKPMEES